MEKIAAKYVLDNISASYDRTSGLVARVASFTEDTGLPLTLGNFLDYYHLELILKEAEAACWLTKDELDSVQWLPADQTILEKIREMMK